MDARGFVLPLPPVRKATSGSAAPGVTSASAASGASVAAAVAQARRKAKKAGRARTKRGSLQKRGRQRQKGRPGTATKEEEEAVAKGDSTERRSASLAPSPAPAPASGSVALPPGRPLESGGSHSPAELTEDKQARRQRFYARSREGSPLPNVGSSPSPPAPTTSGLPGEGVACNACAVLLVNSSCAVGNGAAIVRRIEATANSSRVTTASVW